MKICEKCSAKLKEDAKFCSECGEKVVLDDQENNISLKDAILWQDNLKKDIDFSKADEELTPGEFAKKAIYNAIEETLEESLGEKKKEIDALREQADFTATVDDNLIKLIAVGKEIEKNFFTQKSYLVIFFEDEPENHFKVVVNDLAQQMLGDKSLTNEDRINLANKTLEIVGAYRKKMLKELILKEEIINSLTKTFEEIIETINFGKFSEKINNDISDIKTNSIKWIQLTKQLVPYRHKAIEAVKERLDMEEVVPRLLIENDGDPTAKGGKEMFIFGERMTRLVKEASDGENRIGTERDVLSEWLFGKPEEYMDFMKEAPEEEKAKENSPISNAKKWKWGIVIALSIIALAWSVWTAIGVFVLGVIVISLIKD